MYLNTVSVYLGEDVARVAYFLELVELDVQMRRIQHTNLFVKYGSCFNKSWFF